MGVGLVIYKNRTRVIYLTVAEADGSEAVFGEGDVMRLKVGRLGQTPVLDLNSQSPLAASHCTPENPTCVTFHSNDLGDDITPGMYTYEIAIYDKTETTIKGAGFGVLAILNSPRGATS